MSRFIELIKYNLVVETINVIFEIGSMDGKDAILLKESFPKAIVYAFEGLEENYNLFLKDLQGIQTFNTVIFNYNGEITYHKKNINGIHGVFDRGEIYGTQKIKTKCKRIDTICKELKISNIDIVKIDVEGATYEVLEGFGDILQTVKIMHLETEEIEFFKNQKLDIDVNRFLIQREFKCLEKQGCVITENKKQYDSVWVKNGSNK